LKTVVSAVILAKFINLLANVESNKNSAYSTS